MPNHKNSSSSSFSQQRNKISLSISSRLLASIVLGAFFLSTGVFPFGLVVTTADELPEDYEFKAPQTVNVPSDETRDFNGYNNDIKVEIPEDGDAGLLSHVDAGLLSEITPSELQPGTSTTIDTTLPVAISNLMKSYQQRILLALNLKDNRESTLKTILAKAYPTIRDTIQNAYASQPFTTNSVMALFNNTNYLGLRQQAEDRKKKNQEKAKDKLIDQNKKLRTLLAKTLKTIKERL